MHATSLSKGDLVMYTHYGLAGREPDLQTIFVGVMVLTPLGAEELIGDPRWPASRSSRSPTNGRWTGNAVFLGPYANRNRAG